MKPVDQTEIGVDNPRANCLMAAVASIVETSVADLPCIYAAEERGLDWFAVLRDAVQPFGKVPVVYCNSEHFPAIAPRGFHIACGQSPRDPDGKHGHAVVALNGKIVHDPHPTRAGLHGPITWWILLVDAPWPADPERDRILAELAPGEVAADVVRLAQEFEDGRWVDVDPAESRRWAGTPGPSDWVDVLQTAAGMLAPVSGLQNALRAAERLAESTRDALKDAGMFESNSQCARDIDVVLATAKGLPR